MYSLKKLKKCIASRWVAKTYRSPNWVAVQKTSKRKTLILCLQSVGQSVRVYWERKKEGLIQYIKRFLICKLDEKVLLFDLHLSMMAVCNALFKLLTVTTMKLLNIKCGYN
ncbi:hypothetical protein T07_11458 [Trichinella nelsoni]|uniref:Uncharacterized protein n=1 Tax=Trichinella nelsoni TaxID=6336 RepID=A0A0V0REP9_9BILA|nr:hypothetical protein T07_11458 [Trichinella nelsoni]